MTVSPESGARARRLPPEERRRDILEAGAAIALAEGLGRVTARNVASSLGVRPGLIVHYFATIDLLLAEIFRMLGEQGRLGFRHVAHSPLSPTGYFAALVRRYTGADRDPVSLMWLDAWRQAADRPQLRDAVTAQMEADFADVKAVIDHGVAAGDFVVPDPGRSAMRILGILDGQIVTSVVRAATLDTFLDYGPVVEMAFESVERELGLGEGALRRP